LDRTRESIFLNTTIRKGSIIGAESIVKSIEISSMEIHAGNPIKFIKIDKVYEDSIQAYSRSVIVQILVAVSVMISSRLYKPE
jgi:carbonic anhydrase/acetyltransferase-like protein (isoleucine patch superfamily)